MYVRQQIGSVQDKQLSVIREKVGNKLVRIGLQPGEILHSSYLSGVEDTWTAECQGLNNKLWETPVFYKGTDIYGRKLLEEWVMERINGENRKIVWDMIPVAWDYDAPVDSFGYICPGDDALINDPPILGRIDLCDEYIQKCYEGGIKNKKFGGYACDLHILEANSSGKPERPTFYEQLRLGKPYLGYYSVTMEEIARLYGRFNAP